jgi:hypothetical protein
MLRYYPNMVKASTTSPDIDFKAHTIVTDGGFGIPELG